MAFHTSRRGSACMHSRRFSSAYSAGVVSAAICARREAAMMAARIASSAPVHTTCVHWGGSGGGAGGFATAASSAAAAAAAARACRSRPRRGAFLSSHVCNTSAGAAPIGELSPAKLPTPISPVSLQARAKKGRRHPLRCRAALGSTRVDSG
eukprot:466881-Prorocentrum_minimum.AAC.7